jgi:Spy/CpxP family protein refolding chaperone
MHESLPVPPPEKDYRERADNPSDCNRDGDGFAHFIRKRLNLDQNQFEQFKSLRNQSKEEQMVVKKQIDEKRRMMMSQLASEKPDTAKMNDLIKDIGVLHEELSKITMEHFLQLKSICNEEQRKELNNLIMRMADHKERHLRYRNKRHNRN